ncbi:MAG: hypothetical protein ACPGVB_00635 [Chitinophagales bacterium]
MCKTSPFFYSFCLLILLSSLQVCNANNKASGNSQNQNGTEQSETTMVDAPQKATASKSELQMVHKPTQNPNSSSRIEREGTLVDIADLGGGKQATPPKNSDNNPMPKDKE